MRKNVKYYCPNEECKNHLAPEPRFFHRIGFYITKWNHQPVPRYRCKTCSRGFSSHTFYSTYRQKRPDLNHKVFELYDAGMTQRRMAQVLRCNKNTIARKFWFLSLRAAEIHAIELTKLRCEEIQFDEMESFEHTRLKPLNIPTAVSGDGKKIIHLGVGQMGYRGRLAHLAFKKYGPRTDTSRFSRETALKVIENVRPSVIVTDSKSQYQTEIASLLKGVHHLKVNNRKNKHLHVANPLRRKNVEDRMFWLNHIAARIRHDVSRMKRKVWTTTKEKSFLQAHLNLYIAYHNGYDLTG